MAQQAAFYVVLIALIVVVSTKFLPEADNEAESDFYSSVASSNICNNHEKKEVAFDVILIDSSNSLQHETNVTHNNKSKRQAPRTDRRKDYKNRPRPDQRSLLIVFDATGSMHDDLTQLRAGAQEIINEMSARDDNPIYNYVLVVYRDPSEYFSYRLSLMCHLIAGQLLRYQLALFTLEFHSFRRR